MAFSLAHGEKSTFLRQEVTYFNVLRQHSVASGTRFDLSLCRFEQLQLEAALTDDKSTQNLKGITNDLLLLYPFVSHELRFSN